MRKFISLLFMAMLISISIFAQTVTIGTGTNTDRRPFGMYWGYERTAMLYTASEIGITGNIASLGWYIQSLSSANNGPVKIYLKTTTLTSLAANTWANFILGATLVYDNTNTIFTAGGWQTFDLTNMFNYTGNNLLVLVETNYHDVGGPCEVSSTAKAIRYSTTTDNMMEYWYKESSPPPGDGSISSNRPNLRISLAVALDAGVSAINTPSSPVAIGTGNVEVNIHNFGTSTLTSATIAWKVNGVLQTPFLWSGSIASTATYGPITLGSYNFSAYGPYTIKVWTETPNNGTDQNHANDTITKNVYVQNYAIVPFTENFEANWINKNSTYDVPNGYWINTPATGGNSWRRNDQGSTAGWYDLSYGGYTPAGEGGTLHSARFHTYGAPEGTSGTLDLFLDFSDGGEKLLQFYYINIDGTDSLSVYVSSNNGADFSLVQSYKTVTVWHLKQIWLGTSASANTILRFKATSDFYYTDIGIDEISITTDITGNKDYSNNSDVSIFPNPANGLTNIEINGINDGKLEINNLQGQKIYTEKINDIAISKQLDLSYLPKGIYMVRVFNENNNILRKLIIQ